MDKDYFNRILGIKESYEMPGKLMEFLKDDTRRILLFEKLAESENLDRDFTRDYFQSEHGDRDALKQDYTPDSICEILGKIAGEFDSCADICAGTGALTISQWTRNKEAFFYCEEYSSRAIPVLLLNLAIRGMNGQVVQGNSLTCQIERIYNLRNNGKFSSIEETTEQRKCTYDIVITNPPYSMSWKEVNDYKDDERFKAYGVPPSSKADYAFLLHALSKRSGKGKLMAIVPHGLLFRGSKEGEIRQRLIDRKELESVIGLPENLFLNTGIPVCILTFKNENESVFFINASNEFKKDKPINLMTDQHIDKVTTAYKHKWEIEKLSHIATYEEIQKNNYNLNIPRYVDTFEKEPVPDLKQAIDEYVNVCKEISDTEEKLLSMLRQLEGKGEKAKDLEHMTQVFEHHVLSKKEKDKPKQKELAEQIKLF